MEYFDWHDMTWRSGKTKKKQNKQTKNKTYFEGLGPLKKATIMEEYAIGNFTTLEYL